MSSNGGIIRTESGRQTYAPDGLVSSESNTNPLTVNASSATRSTSNTSDTLQPEPSGDSYVDSEGKEIDEPIDSDESFADKDAAYEPIQPGDRETLMRLATNRSQLSHSHTTSTGNDLERRDTLAGIELGDPILDPNSPQFDLYKWLRMFMRLLDEEEIRVKRAGIVFKNLNVSGSGAALNLQKNVGSFFMAPLRLNEYFNFGKKPVKHILNNFDGVMKSGELLIVLGRPGSGCSTLLKSMCGELHGLHVDDGSVIHYNGITQKQMLKEFKGEVVYNQEVDKHFPHLTVGQTLEHAAALRTPSHRVKDISRKDFAKHITQVTMAVFGLSHTYNTKVGDDFVRGVSGGERKRVSIAEMALSAAPLAAWDNSTRGLDSKTALEFVKSLRLSANLGGSAHAVAIYQASQAIYDQFDKAVVLYEGRQIFFGPVGEARRYFEEMGWFCPQRQTTGDFLTSVTNPSERQAKEGMDKNVPRTPEEFEAYWRKSSHYAALQKEIAQHEEVFPVGDTQLLSEFRSSKREAQAKHTRAKSSFVVSVPMQIKLNTKRAYQRIWNDKAATATTIIGQIIMALIVGSVFYGTPDATQVRYSRYKPSTLLLTPPTATFLHLVDWQAADVVTSVASLSAGLYRGRPRS